VTSDEVSLKGKDDSLANGIIVSFRPICFKEKDFKTENSAGF
jgi:hypothetical protein